MANDTQVTDYAGSFIQGGWGTVRIQVLTVEGASLEPEGIEVEVRPLATTEVVTSGTPVRIGRGFYVFDWPISETQTPGRYSVVWTYEVGGSSRTVTQQIVVVEDGGSNAVHTAMMTLMRIKLEQMLSALQSIFIYMEQALPTADFQTYAFSFQRWNQAAGVRVYRNQILITDGYEVDYLNGRITFDVPNLPEDQVHVDYNFRFFSDDDLNLFLLNGLNVFNLFAPHTNASFLNLPDKYIPPTLYGAAVDAIRAFMQQLIWPRTRALFETPQGADKAYDQYETLKKNYEETWKMLVEQKKLFPYAGLTRLIIQPMFTLPGGRARFFRYLFSGGF
jgi:hypothetical protein